MKIKAILFIVLAFLVLGVLPLTLGLLGYEVFGWSYMTCSHLTCFGVATITTGILNIIETVLEAKASKKAEKEEN